MADQIYHTRHYRVRLNSSFPWNRTDFALLGIIDLGDAHIIGWAWHADGTSIDEADRAFDLIDFPAVEIPPYFWLGAEAA